MGGAAGRSRVCSSGDLSPCELRLDTVDVGTELRVADGPVDSSIFSLFRSIIRVIHVYALMDAGGYQELIGG